MAIERINLTRSDFIRIENEIRLHEHLRRYSAIRRYCFGKTLDFPCGVGYGTYLLAANPEITSIVGVDKDESSILWAKKEFSHEKIEFVCEDIEDFFCSADTLVCLEAIEHFLEPRFLPNCAKKANAKQVIISFPDKKSTHFNPFHLHDFTVQEVLDLFPEYVCYNEFKMGDVQFLLFLQKPESAPSHIFRNLPSIRK
ncbi:MAG: class I SAM-dependent methyltransferase [Candidatus Riflebacteria bacterium]|nr:class I SAM-dependent methyltransferase [Candidatus Riflebacteria bacterium]